MGHEARARAQGALASKVMLAFAAGGSVTTPFCVSLARLVGYETTRPVADRKLSFLGHAEGLYISENRQHITFEFFKRQEPWLAMLDSDIDFPPTLLDSLLGLTGNGERKIIAANVPLGYRPNVAFMKVKEPCSYTNLFPLPPEPFPVDAVATAVFMVHRDVIVDMHKAQGPRWFQHWYPDETTELGDFDFLGEDLAFCRRARAVGHQCWVGHVKGLGHNKRVRLSEDEPPAREKIANEMVRLVGLKLRQIEAKEAELDRKLRP